MRKTFKAMIVIFLIIILGFTVWGCNGTDQVAENQTATEKSEKVYLGLERITTSGDFIFYREKSTDVIYIYSYEAHGYAAGAGITVMLNPETGLPLTYTVWQEEYQNNN